MSKCELYCGELSLCTVYSMELIQSNERSLVARRQNVVQTASTTPYLFHVIYSKKSKVIPLQARCGPEGG